MTEKDFFGPKVNRFRRALTEVKDAKDALRDSFGLAGESCLILCDVAKTPEISYPMLEKKTGFPISTIRTRCMNLKRKGLIEARTGSDKRHRLTLTPAGEKKHREIVRGR